MSEVYENLAKHLDNLPGGFPATDSGVELRILKRLFSNQEAEVAQKLSMMPGRQNKLKEAVKDLYRNYDYTLID